MFDSKNHNPSCSFAKECVSYIYDEMDLSEETNFETHLAECSPCADEIASFSALSFSIKEWRDEEFANLKTPQITIPFETSKQQIVSSESVSDSRTWLEKLADLFSLSPAMLKTAGAFAAILLAVGLGWFVLTSFENGEKNIAATENNSKEQENSVVTQTEPKEIEKEIAQTNEKNETVEDSADNEDVSPQIENETVAPVKTSVKKPIKIASRKPVSVQKKTIVAENKKPVKKKNPVKVDKKEIETQQETFQNAPRLTDFAMEDSEDETLRLSDLFADDESDK